MADDLTGPEHYSRAVSLLKEAGGRKQEGRTEAERARMLAEAQVHATLALIASNVHGGGTSKDDVERWKEKGVHVIWRP